MLENVIESTVCDYAKSLGWSHRKMVYAGRKSALDRMFFMPTRKIIFIEFKAPGEEPRLDQVREMERLLKAGFPTYVVDDIATGKALIDKHTTKRRRGSHEDFEV